MAADPGKGALDDPALRQHDELVQLASLDDLQPPATGLGDRPGGAWPLVTGIGEDLLDEGKRSACLAQHRTGAVAVLYAGRMHDDAQQEAKRVDQDVTLAAGDLLARVVALRVDRRPPFCAALALWLSMIAAVGLASRPSRSRTAT